MLCVLSNESSSFILGSNGPHGRQRVKFYFLKVTKSLCPSFQNFNKALPLSRHSCDELLATFFLIGPVLLNDCSCVKIRGAVAERAVDITKDCYVFKTKLILDTD